MKPYTLTLTDNSSGEELKVGSFILDDENNYLFITGYGQHPVGGPFVEVVKMDDLRDIVSQLRPDSLDLKLEVKVLGEGEGA